MEQDILQSSSKEQVFSKLLALMNEFDRVCRENGLKYSLSGGSLLGAVRHNGFIPWDDDVDIIMFRDSYNRLLELGRQGIFQAPYFLQSPETDPGSPRLFLRLRDSSTTSISHGDAMYKMNQGIFIDIFPADYFPRDPRKQKSLVHKLSLYNKLSGGYARFYSGNGTETDGLNIKLQYLILYPLYKTGLITSGKLFQKFNKAASSFSSEECDDIANSIWLVYDSNFHFSKKCFEDGFVMHKFEKYSFPIYVDYDEVLTFCYGDYMTPVQAPTCHGNLIQRVDVPYQDYIAAHYQEVKEKFGSR